MFPRVALRRLTAKEISAAIIENNDDTNDAWDADYADDEEDPVDSVSDSENDEIIDDGESQNGDSDDESIGETDDESIPETFVSVDGTEWQRNPVPTPRETTRARQSALKKLNLVPGQRLDMHQDYFLTIFDKKIIDTVVQYTNIEAVKHKPNFVPIDAIEMKAFFGVLFAAGVDRSSKRNYEEFFGVLRGLPIIRATMSIN